LLPLLLPNAADFTLEQVEVTDMLISLSLRTTGAGAPCPMCSQPSHRVHSRYARQAKDLPAQGHRVTLCLTVRKFFCCNPECPRTVFCERLPHLLPSHTRATARLTEAHRTLGFALGGEAGARVARQLAMPTSPDTLLRRVKECPQQPESLPRVVGVDDWALRKGQRYGTILTDLERGGVIDLLRGRDGSALLAWLKDHPHIEVVSRDRWAPFAQAIAEALPQALQVADRWHLLKNLREAVERFFQRRYATIKQTLQLSAAVEPSPTPSNQPLAEETVRVASSGSTVLPAIRSSRSQSKQAKRQHRIDRYQNVRQRHGQGQSIRDIARELQMSRKTVRRYLHSEQCPDWVPGYPRPTRLDQFRDVIDQRILEGCRNAAEVYRELATKGCTASYEAVRRFFTRRLAGAGQKRQRINAATCQPPAPPSARQLSFEFVRLAVKREVEEQTRMEALRGIDAEFQETMALAEEFAAMVRKQSKMTLAVWLEKTAASVCPEIQGFAEGIRQDEAAVGAALQEKWSNGPVEGHVNRLKVIKRQMYGRAGLPLLRARVIHGSGSGMAKNTAPPRASPGFTKSAGEPKLGGDLGGISCGQPSCIIFIIQFKPTTIILFFVVARIERIGGRWVE
jgi:transposase